MPNSIDPQAGLSAGWYLGINNQQVGPMDSAEIAQMARAGSVTADTLAWRAGMANWQPAHAVAELAPHNRKIQDVASSPLMMAAFACGIIGVLSALSRQGKSGSPFAVICGIVGFICTAAFYSRTSNQLMQETKGIIQLEPRIGFYAICGFFLVGCILNGFSLIRGPGNDRPYLD